MSKESQSKSSWISSLLLCRFLRGGRCRGAMDWGGIPAEAEKHELIVVGARQLKVKLCNWVWLSYQGALAAVCVPACAQASEAAVLRWRRERWERRRGARGEWGWRGSEGRWGWRVAPVGSGVHREPEGSCCQRWSCLSGWRSGSESHRGRWTGPGPGPSRRAPPDACSPVGLGIEKYQRALNFTKRGKIE